jgi:hypothetical protein
MKIYHETILKALILLVEHGLVYGIHTKPSVVQVDGHKRQYAWDELLFGLQEDIWMPVLEEVHAKTPLKTYDIQYNNFYMFREGLYNSIAMYMRSANTCMNYTMEGCESFHRILEEMKTEMAGLSAQLVSRPAESFHHMVEDMRTEMEATKEELSALKAQLASRPADTFATYSVPIVPIAKEEHVDRHVPTPSRGETAAPISEPESKNDHYIGISLLVLVLALAVNLYCQNEILTPLRLQLSSY